MCLFHTCSAGSCDRSFWRCGRDQTSWRKMSLLCFGWAIRGHPCQVLRKIWCWFCVRQSRPVSHQNQWLQFWLEQHRSDGAEKLQSNWSSGRSTPSLHSCHVVMTKRRRGAFWSGLGSRFQKTGRQRIPLVERWTPGEKTQIMTKKTWMEMGKNYLHLLSNELT